MTATHSAGWTPEREAEAKRLYIDQGMSAAETAKALGGGVTRNGVIGIAHRRGWMNDHRQKPTSTGRPLRAPSVSAGPANPRGVRGHPSGAKPPKPGPHLKPGAVFGLVATLGPEEAKRRSEASAAAGRKLVSAFAAPANDDAILLINRRAFQCSWPVGEPERPADQLCCGQPVPEGANKAVPTYCEAHAARAVNRSMLGSKPDVKAYERSLRRFANA